MIFSTYTFIFIFLPITFLGYRLLTYVKEPNVAKLWLVIASIYFYAQGSGNFVVLFMLDILVNFAIGNLIVKAGKRRSNWSKRLLLTIGLLLNVAFLGYYKYANFAIENVNHLTGQAFPLLEIILPLGISFYTFQLIAYLVDCYKGLTKKTPIVDFLLFITFFPQLIVGPIVHHADVIPQYQDKAMRRINSANMMLGIFLFSIGCAKKIMLADPITSYASAFYANVGAGDTLSAWLASVGYTISYYFDLSGYADMALGLALLFNIRLPHNFNSPYKARNFREYWQRWHMTLSKFLSDYIFRSFYRKGSGSFNFYFAVMMTFFVSGFWHGAGWQFIVWGIINGIFVCMAHFMYRNKWKLPFFLAWTLTFAGVVGTRILFVSDTMGEAWTVIRKMFSVHDFAGMDMSAALTKIVSFGAYNAYTIALLFVGMAISFFGKNSTQMAQDFKPNIRYAVAAALLLGISLAQMTSVSNFLYFQF
ncbi:MBOAT family O-acyltransferase [Paenibacillus paeoniae]|uniref:MBOAT family protein n=1 Tax=Paenibacillus paeoniae TaxID=2292705 RepID=A0A371PN25_9BACL|nr:MBOAT family O-acyltransferase [Paenibacillus paeoniae]REK77069.1 MBOAT family protein [Paenibacillus paeoniae]